MQGNNEPTSRDYLYDKIADILENDIVSGSFGTEKLPSEQNLAGKYNVSRTVIREALKILGERHLIFSMAGSGAFITKPDAFDLSLVLNRLISTHDISYLDAFDVRIILETSAASRAAQFVTEEELAEMRELIAILKEPGMPIKERNAYDFRFHMMVAKASHNPLLALLADAMSNIILDIINISVAGGNERGADRVINHSKIVSALEAREPNTAEHMMYDHLYNSRIFYRQYLEENKLTLIRIQYENMELGR
ncbi:MAG: FadR family transcriptional regulator [Clostridia bacterium]|nr:FadR family transcriptional regulator [Clostridia bacterium]